MHVDSEMRDSNKEKTGSVVCSCLHISSVHYSFFPNMGTYTANTEHENCTSIGVQVSGDENRQVSPVLE